MSGMFAGAYWSKRPETKEEAAHRVVGFLSALGKVNGRFGHWFLLGDGKTEKHPVELSVREIASLMRAQRNDVGHNPLPDLGYTFSVWNGDDVHFHVSIGSFSQFVGNSAVLSVGAKELGGISDDQWRSLLRTAIDSFHPDHAVVGRGGSQESADMSGPWDIAWLSYDGQGEITEVQRRR